MLFNHSKLSFIIKTSSCLFILFSNCSDMGKKKEDYSVYQVAFNISSLFAQGAFLCTVIVI